MTLYFAFWTKKTECFAISQERCEKKIRLHLKNLFKLQCGQRKMEKSFCSFLLFLHSDPNAVVVPRGQRSHRFFASLFIIALLRPFFFVRLSWQQKNPPSKPPTASSLGCCIVSTTTTTPPPHLADVISFAFRI